MYLEIFCFREFLEAYLSLVGITWFSAGVLASFHNQPPLENYYVISFLIFTNDAGFDGAFNSPRATTLKWYSLLPILIMTLIILTKMGTAIFSSLFHGSYIRVAEDVMFEFLILVACIFGAIFAALLFMNLISRLGYALTEMYHSSHN